MDNWTVSDVTGHAGVIEVTITLSTRLSTAEHLEMTTQSAAPHTLLSALSPSTMNCPQLGSATSVASNSNWAGVDIFLIKFISRVWRQYIGKSFPMLSGASRLGAASTRLS